MGRLQDGGARGCQQALQPVARDFLVVNQQDPLFTFASRELIQVVEQPAAFDGLQDDKCPHRVLLPLLDPQRCSR